MFHTSKRHRAGSTGCTFSSLFSLSSVLAHLIMWEAAPLPCGEWRQRRAQLCPGRESWASTGQSHRKHFTVKSLLKILLSRHLLFLKLFMLRTALLELLKVSNTQSHHCSSCQGCKWSPLRAQASVASCFAQTFLVKTRVFHLMSASISLLGLTLRFSFHVMFWNLCLWCGWNTSFNKCQEQIKEN